MKYAYKVLPLVTGHRTTMITEGELNNLGEAGWRLASVVDTDDGANGIFYRSRQAEEDTQIGHAPAVEEKPSKKEMWLR